MQPLIDADVLRYEIGSVGQFKNENGEIEIRSFKFVQRQLEHTISAICEAVGATEEPTLFLTGSESLYSKRLGRTLPPFKPNFREEVAVTKPYKGSRKNEKPFHFNNLTLHMESQYNTVISNGIEADDAMCIEQYKDFILGNNKTIICTRDKDLRMCPGWHYGWNCGLQKSFGPYFYDELGEIELDETKSQKKVVGGGFLFFASQLLTGDSVDNIPGLPKCGPVKAVELLKDCDSVDSALNAVREAYREKLGDSYPTYLQEQTDLLWMIRELTDEGPRRLIVDGGEYRPFSATIRKNNDIND